MVELERERDILKKVRGLLRQGTGSLLEVVRSPKKASPVSLMCRLLKVPRSSYYAFAGRVCKPAASPALLRTVRQIHSECRSSYGGRRMARAAARSSDRTLRARSLMREAQLAVVRRRTHRYRKAEGEALAAPNLLERKFESGAINRVRG